MNANVDISKVMLETNRLIIRPWRKSDLEDAYENLVGREAGYVLSKEY